MEVKEQFEELGTSRKSEVILFSTYNAIKQIQVPICHEMYDCFVNTLILLSEKYKNKKIPKLSMILNTTGGTLPAARSIVKLIREFSDKFEIIVPKFAMSAGTLMCLSADRLIMFNDANLGPLDPSISDFNYPANPSLSAAYLKAKFIDRNENTDKNLTIEDLKRLSYQYDPILIGQAFRAFKQMENFISEALGDKLSLANKKDAIYFLLYKLNNHGYKISKEEAQSKLHISVESISYKEEQIIKDILDFSQSKQDPYQFKFLFSKNDYE